MKIDWLTVAPIIDEPDKEPYFERYNVKSFCMLYILCFAAVRQISLFLPLKSSQTCDALVSSNRAIDSTAPSMHISWSSAMPCEHTSAIL
jgi:hypothetical protein